MHTVYSRGNRTSWFYVILRHLGMPEPDKILAITVHRKPTDTDQYLLWDSHHNIAAKYSVVNTLHIEQMLSVPTFKYCKKKNTRVRYYRTASTQNGC